LNKKVELLYRSRIKKRLNRFFYGNRRKFLKTIFSWKTFLFILHLSSLVFFKKSSWAGYPFTQADTGSRSITGSKTPRSKVLIVKNNSLVDPSTGNISPIVLKKMINRGMMALTGQKEISSCWKKFFSPNDIVGIKVNCLGGRMIATHPELVTVIMEGLRKAGIPDNQIIIWDRLTEELKKAGYRTNLRSRGVKCFGTDAVGYDPIPELVGSIGSCFSKIISTHCTALINVPVLKDHDLAGVSLGMKNFFGAIHNPNKYHDSNCNPYVADLNSHPYIKNKLRMVVLDGITAQCNGGPAYNAKWNWNYSGILVSRDPVALDRIGTKIIEEQRKKEGLLPLNQVKRYPQYISTAARLHLGESDIEKIEVTDILT